MNPEIDSTVIAAGSEWSLHRGSPYEHEVTAPSLGWILAAPATTHPGAVLIVSPLLIGPALPNPTPRHTSADEASAAA